MITTAAEHVRRATMHDVDGIIAVREAYCHALKAQFGELAPHDPESTRQYCLAFMDRPDAIVLVGLREDAVVGALLLLLAPYPINMTVRMAVQLMLYVIPEARGTGIGTRLFEAGEQWAKEQGAAFCIVSFRAGMETAQWFEHRGYTVMEPTLVKRF